MSKKFHDPLGALEADTRAMESAVEFAADMGVLDVILKGDSLLIWRALQDHAVATASVENVILGILQQLYHSRKVVFSLIKSQGNGPLLIC